MMIPFWLLWFKRALEAWEESFPRSRCEHSKYLSALCWLMARLVSTSIAYMPLRTNAKEGISHLA